MTTTEKPLASAAKAPGAATEKPTTASPASKGAGVPPLRKKSSASTSSVGDAKDKDKDKDKITKRRAARACVSCRARKVRCDVVEGAPCGNCRWDNVECIVQESRRRKKNIFTASNGAGHVAGGAEALRAKPLSANPISITSADLRKPSTATTISMTGIENSAAGGGAAPLMDGIDGHMPHLIYQRQNGFQPDTAALLSKLGDASNPQLLWSNPVLNQTSLFGDLRTNQFLNSLEEPDLDAQLPAFIKPLPSKIAAEDEKYLKTKGALTLPSLSLQSGLLKAYIEFVHPYMPIIELHDFLAIVNSREGFHGQVSLFLYQAVMFSATAFVGTKYLKEAGYSSRRAARKDFFTKTRLLYDFDYESDRLVLVQALLLMTYWYETPDDQKDTWHWMGVAISLAHTIGLHRNPANTNMAPRKQKLWKRIWWSCFMRDRLIALGMRRPTRIKDEDYDVPMLEMADFEIEVLASDNQIIPAECLTIRDISMQQQLAEMCVQKTRLCVLVSQMLKAQYSVLIRDPARPDQTTNSTMMLFPNKTLENVGNVNMVDLELTSWLEALPPSCKYRPITSEEVKKGQAALAVQRSLLHMVYYTTISALHRPQFLPSSPLQQPSISRQIQEMSRMRVRDSANQITNMVAELHKYHLEKFLPTTGVTVILPAMIIHLLEMKNPLSETRERATRGFQQCMQVMVQLREIYAAADFATGFLDAALRKASIDMAGIDNQQATAAAASLNLGNLMAQQQNAEDLSTPPPENAPYLNSTEVKLYHSHRSYMQKTGSTSVAPDGAGHSPPPTEKDLDSAVGLTPSASGSSEGGMVDGDFGMGQESIDWNAVSGTNLDFDQWLQFPAEGVNNTDDAFMGMFDAGEDAGHQALPTQTLSWAGTADDKMDIDGQAGLPILA